MIFFILFPSFIIWFHLNKIGKNVHAFLLLLLTNVYCGKCEVLLLIACVWMMCFGLVHSSICHGRLYAFVSKCWTILHAFACHGCVCPSELCRISMHVYPWRFSTTPCIASHMGHVQPPHAPNRERILCALFGSVVERKKEKKQNWKLAIDLGWCWIWDCSVCIFASIRAYNLTKKQTKPALNDNAPKEYWHTALQCWIVILLVFEWISFVVIIKKTHIQERTGPPFRRIKHTKICSPKQFWFEVKQIKTYVFHGGAFKSLDFFVAFVVDTADFCGFKTFVEANGQLVTYSHLHNSKAICKRNERKTHND